MQFLHLQNCKRNVSTGDRALEMLRVANSDYY